MQSMASRRMARNSYSACGHPSKKDLRALLRMRSVSAWRPPQDEVLRELLPGDPLEIALIDGVPLFFRQVERIENAERLADVHRALLGIERAVGGEHDLYQRIELHAELGRGIRGEHRRIGVEILLEVVERALLQRLVERAAIPVRGARAELIPAGADAAFEHRHDAAEVMHDELQVRVLVERHFG